jgi:yeast amino acid transporter
VTIAIQNAGWEGGVHLINAFIFITVLSAANSSIYIGSRTIVFMAQEKMAPKFLGYTNSRGVPGMFASSSAVGVLLTISVYAMIFTNLFGALSMMNVSTGGGKAYSYIINLSGVSAFIVWGAISFTHIRFRQHWAAQGRTADSLPFKSILYPYNSYFGLAINIFLALVQGWTTLAPFDAGLFVDAYILLPLFGIVFAVYKFWFKTRWYTTGDVDLDAGQRRDLDDREVVEEVPVEGEEKKTFAKRLWRNF